MNYLLFSSEDNANVLGKNKNEKPAASKLDEFCALEAKRYAYKKVEEEKKLKITKG